MLLVQMVLAFAFFVQTTDYFTLQSETEVFSGAETWLPRWLRRLRVDSKQWLFGDADCSESMAAASEYGADYGQAVDVEEPADYCGVVYSLLHPEGTLDVVSFVEDMYSLSSTPFLLLVR